MKTIFLIHDQEEDPAARKNFLEMSGYRVKLMQSGRELSLALRDERPDLVMVDILINGRNGFEVAREFCGRISSTPLILCSRIYHGHAFHEEAQRLGAADYLTLPMNLDDFVARVIAVLNGRASSVA